MLTTATIAAAGIGLAVGLLVYVLIDERNNRKERAQERKRYWAAHFVVVDSRTRGA